MWASDTFVGHVPDRDFVGLCNWRNPKPREFLHDGCDRDWFFVCLSDDHILAVFAPGQQTNQKQKKRPCVWVSEDRN